MKVLVVVNGGPHSHDYGIDYLLDGLRTVCGPENVFDVPEKPGLHLAPGAPRDECNIDSDAWWPSKGDLVVEDVARAVDVVLVSYGPTGVPPITHQIANRLCAVAAHAPVAVIDVCDMVADLRAFYGSVVQRPFLYFKRELPLGADWGLPCPLTYPAWKAPTPLPHKRNAVFYHATDHGGGPPGIPRHIIVDGLRERLAADQMDVLLTPSQENRLSPEEYHELMARCSVGIAWNGAPNWDNNRYWEGHAFGLCQVAERPRIQIPHPFEHGEQVLYVDEPAEVAPMVKMMIDDPDQARRIAQAGHQWFLQHHAADRRAQYVLDAIGAAGA